jgi:hypothetical protein
MTTKRLQKFIMAAGFVLGVAPSLLHAQEPGADDDGWQFAMPVYLWGADIAGTSQPGLSIDAEFGDVLDNLEMGFMGAFEARKGNWSILTGIVYLDISADNPIDVSFPANPGSKITTNANLELTGWVYNLAGGYTLFSRGESKLDLVAGARYLDLDTTLALDLKALGPGKSQTLAESGSFWDAIVGVKGNIAMGKRWYFPYYVDIGTGQSDSTWQAIAGVSFRAAKWVDIALVYRYLEWQFDSDTLLEDLSFSGPALGAIFRF